MAPGRKPQVLKMQREKVSVSVHVPPTTCHSLQELGLSNYETCAHEDMIITGASTGGDRVPCA